MSVMTMSISFTHFKTCSVIKSYGTELGLARHALYFCITIIQVV